MEKQCKKCSEVKPLSEFYGNKGTIDGTINECKLCVKKRVKEREQLKRQDPEWIKKEQERQRQKYYRLDYKEKHKPTSAQKKKQIKNYKERYPEKVYAKNRCSHLKPEIKGNHLHHWSYREEHIKDVIEISKIEHYYLHRHIIYDQERMMYRRCDSNLLLDSREAHESYIKELFTVEF